MLSPCSNQSAREDGSNSMYSSTENALQYDINSFISEVSYSDSFLMFACLLPSFSRLSIFTAVPDIERAKFFLTTLFSSVFEFVYCAYGIHDFPLGDLKRF